MLFWILATLMAAAVAATVLAPLWRRGAGPAEAGDMAIYRDQLAEVDRDLARGTLDAGEAGRVRTEVARRLLAADRAAPEATADAPRRADAVLAGIVAVALIGGGLWSYDWLGAPGYPDLPRADRIARSAEMRADRISQADAERTMAAAIAAGALPDPATEMQARLPADYIDMVDDLRRLVPGRPDDLEGWRLLARHEAQLGRFADAARAQARVIALAGDDATAGDRIALVDRMVAAASGALSPEAETVLVEVLQVEPQNVAARYYSALLYAQTDRPDLAFRLWRDIVAEADPGDPHARLARAQVEDAAYRAGIDYSLPPERGPGAADIAAATDMTPEARQAMIEGMVAQLSDRLATQGGPASDWARLIAAYGVLGDTDQAAAIWTEAREVFATSEAGLAAVTDAAARAGVPGAAGADGSAETGQ